MVPLWGWILLLCGLLLLDALALFCLLRSWKEGRRLQEEKDARVGMEMVQKRMAREAEMERRLQKPPPPAPPPTDDLIVCHSSELSAGFARSLPAPDTPPPPPQHPGGVRYDARRVRVISPKASSVVVISPAPWRESSFSPPPQPQPPPPKLEEEEDEDETTPMKPQDAANTSTNNDSSWWLSPTLVAAKGLRAVAPPQPPPALPAGVKLDYIDFEDDDSEWKDGDAGGSVLSPRTEKQVEATLASSRQQREYANQLMSGAEEKHPQLPPPPPLPSTTSLGSGLFRMPPAP